MEIGKPQREIFVEPLEMPEPLRAEPERVKETEPSEVPTFSEKYA